MPDWPWFEFVLIGAAAGYLAGFLGIGGGLVIVPALTWLFLRQAETSEHAIHFAVATSLATMLATSLSSIIAHHRRRAIRWPTAIQLAPGLIVGAVAGAVLAMALAPSWLTLVFAGFAVLAGLQLLFAPVIEGEKPLPSRAVNVAVGAIIGGVSSLVGIGGGSMTAPWLLWHGVRAQTAVATAAACGYPIAVAGAATFAWMGLQEASPTGQLGYIHVPAAIGIMVTGVLFAPLGVATVHRLSPGLVKRLFGLALILVALRLAVTQLAP